MRPPTCPDKTNTRRSALDEIADILLDALEREDVADVAVANVSTEIPVAAANDAERAVG